MAIFAIMEEDNCNHLNLQTDLAESSDWFWYNKVTVLPNDMMHLTTLCPSRQKLQLKRNTSYNS